jgi:putative transposase
MARKPRVHYPGAVYHVMLRGNGGQDIYRFYLLLQEGTERYGYRIHAFCLMSNHVHLAIQVGEVPLSRIMQNIGFRFIRWINWRRGSSGHLFQGRFKAILIEADSYLVELCRYIHLNPVRAGMVQSPEDYRWSGHRAYLGREIVSCLTTDWVLAQFGADSIQARRAYHEYVEQGKDAGHRQEFHRGRTGESRILGNDDFIDRVLVSAEGKPTKKIGLEAILVAVCREYGIEMRELSIAGKYRVPSEARGMAAWLILELGCGTLAELGKFTGRDSTTLSTVAGNLRKRVESDSTLAERMTRLMSSFNNINPW